MAFVACTGLDSSPRDSEAVCLQWDPTKYQYILKKSTSGNFEALSFLK